MGEGGAGWHCKDAELNAGLRVVWAGSCSSDSIPSLGTSTCHRCLKRQKKKKKKRGREGAGWGAWG